MSPQVSKGGAHDHHHADASATSQPRQKRRRGKARPETHAREATVKSLDHLGLSAAPVHGSKSFKRSKLKKRLHPRRKLDEEEAAASSGDEYSGNLLETYIGQVGACVALGMLAEDVINETAWNRFSEEERDSLRAHLPASLSHADKDTLARNLVSGANVYFGVPRDRVFDAVAAGYTHPRVRRWRLRVSLIERRHHIMSMREYHNRCTRRLLARKALVDAEAEADAAGEALVGLAGAKSAPPGIPVQTPQNKASVPIEPSPTAIHSSIKDWDENRWRRVIDFRNQETKRYRVPERAFRYINPWGHSIVGPLKRGPALDGGRPRGHVLLRSERPSHVTILCIVRDAASRLPGGRGTRADICDLLRDSQYVREDASYPQLNIVVSGALDRLHYEESAPVKYDAESKQWVYLHNDMTEDDFERPVWARCMTQKQLSAAVMNSSTATAREKKQKRKKQKRAEE